MPYQFYVPPGEKCGLVNSMMIQKVMQYLTFTQRVSRYTVYRRPSSAMAALQLLPRTTAISCKSRLALTLEEQR